MPSRWGIVQQRDNREERIMESFRCLHRQNVIVHVILFPWHAEIGQWYRFANCPTQWKCCDIFKS